MIGNDRLHDRQAQAGSVLLGRVVGREQTPGLLLGHSLPGVGQLDMYDAVGAARAHGEVAAGRHRVDGVDQEILNGPSELFNVTTNRSCRRIQVERDANRRRPWRLQLRLEERGALLHERVQ